MKGKYSVFVQNNRLRYEFTISRNITIIRGDSATGKTTLLDLLNAYATFPASLSVDSVGKRICNLSITA